MDNLLKKIDALELDHCKTEMIDLIRSKQDLLNRDYGIEADYKTIFSTIPDIEPSCFTLNTDCITIGDPNDATPSQREDLLKAFKDLIPWRKGPFNLFGIDIDTEWASDIKWNRLKNHIADLNGKKVLDIGCSSGYHLFRIAAHEPFMALGIDPMVNYYYQYKMIQHYLQHDRTYHIPARFEELPALDRYFDTVFHMGVLYHAKSPVDMLKEIKKRIHPDGELVLETLVIEGDTDTALFPRDRYAKMRNVYFIPTVRCLISWLKRAGYTRARCIDVSPTTSDEQRKTDWIITQSLDQFLDPEDNTKTIEGYPAPIRAVVIANPK